jgi:ADP-heptose:LPS heptosyltransferase
VDTGGLAREARLSVEEVEFARFFWESCDSQPGDCAAVNISAGGSNRDWSLDRYEAVCRNIRSMGLVPLIVSSPDDRGKAEELSGRMEDALLSPVTPTILHLSAVMKGVLLLVSPDTSTVHLAASLGIPVVGMYLPFDPALPKWYPWGVPSRVVMSDSSENFDSVSPEGVSAAVREIVAGLL